MAINDVKMSINDVKMAMNDMKMAIVDVKMAINDVKPCNKTHSIFSIYRTSLTAIFKTENI
jgi:hypothetical protein